MTINMVFRAVALAAIAALAGCGQPPTATVADEDPAAAPAVSRETTTSAPTSLPAREAQRRAERGHALPGAMGEPPPELKALSSPIALLAAGGFMDGGTTWVRLRDAEGVEALFCVNQDAFEDAVPPNALFVGGQHPQEVSARLPMSEAEARLLVEGLAEALEPHLTEERRAELAATGDPGEELTYEQLTGRGVRGQRRSEQDWTIIYAHDALRRLRTAKSFPLADPDEVAERTARLSAVDPIETAEAFRAHAGGDRRDDWRRLEPVLLGELRESAPIDDLRTFVEQRLGPSEPEMVAKYADAASFPGGNQGVEGILAYRLGVEFGMEHALIVDLRDAENPSFGIAYGSMGRPNLHPEHDQITDEERELAASLNAIDINLGGGSLDGTYKPGFSLLLAGPNVTEQNVQSLHRLTTLVSLHLRGPEVTDELLALLAGHPYLADVTLQSTGVSDEGLLVLAQLPTLKFVTVWGGAITPAGGSALEAVLPQCKVDLEPDPALEPGKAE